LTEDDERLRRLAETGRNGDPGQNTPAATDVTNP
jgi:hypothetical protein